MELTWKDALTTGVRGAAVGLAIGLSIGLIYGMGFMAYGFYLKPPSTSQDWAAWAQAYGTTIALAIAIYVPARQRRDARAEQRGREAEREALRIQAASLLLSDAEILLEGIVIDPLPRDPRRDEIAVVDLLERMRIAEASDLDPSRTLSIFSARNAVLGVRQLQLERSEAALPLSPADRAQLREAIAAMQASRKTIESTQAAALKAHWTLNPDKWKLWKERNQPAEEGPK